MNCTFVKRYLECISNLMFLEKNHLIELDSVVGDGDLGLTMSDGFLAAFQQIKDNTECDCGKLLYFAGKAMSTAVPSTMGTLMASGLMASGKALKGVWTLEEEHIKVLFASFEEGVMHRGKAKVGDKTFLDGFHPGRIALDTSIHEGLLKSAEKAVLAAQQGYEQTQGMLAIHGRAAARGEASRKLKDPGAYVGVLLMKALQDALN